MSEEQTQTTGAETNTATGVQGTPGAQKRGTPKPPATTEDFKKVKRLGKTLIGIPIFIIIALAVLWPTVVTLDKPAVPTSKNTVTTPPGTTANSPTEPNADMSKSPVEWSKKTNIIKFPISFQLRMILLVLLGGALGSYIHMATSFSTYLGIDQFDMNWFWWYLLRIPIGAVLALIFSLLLQGELLTLPASGAESRQIAIIGIAALVGMFSRQATEKLQEIFDTVFNSKQGSANKERQDKINRESQRGGQEAGTQQH